MSKALGAGKPGRRGRETWEWSEKGLANPIPSIDTETLGLPRPSALDMPFQGVATQARESFPFYSTRTRSLPLRPNVSGEYISSALAGGTTKFPGVVARQT